MIQRTNKANVIVLMSTYNGCRYLAEQIDSILNQSKVKLQLFIRDDGSSDRSVEIIRKYASLYSNIHYTIGKNKGYAKSFMELLLNATDKFDYYCFADQDDVWKDDKISSAISRCEATGDTNATYVSALNYVDDHMNPIRKRDYSDTPVTLKSIFTRMRFAGCTMIFTRKVFLNCVLALRANQSLINTSHDQFVLSVCVASCGTVIVDHTSHIYYRRSKDSLTGSSGSILKRYRYEKKRLLTNDRLDSLSTLLLSTGLAATKQNRYLQLCSQYRESFFKRMLLILSCLYSTKNPILNFEAALKVTLGTF